MNEITGRQRLYPEIPVGVRSGDYVHFFANPNWYDFLFKKRRNRPVALGRALVTYVDGNRIAFDGPLPELVMKGDFMVIERNGR